MTEEDWLACADPYLIVAFLRRTREGKRYKSYRRKFRLFACSTCRTFLPSLEQRYREALEGSEQYADGAMSHSELRRLFYAAFGSDDPTSEPEKTWAFLATHAAKLTIWDHTLSLTRYLTAARGYAPSFTAIMSDEEQMVLLMCIFGNPFRPITLNPHWLTSTVLDLARTIYEERAFDRMPILADALMDRGCDNDMILNHCREPVHCRGCFVVDAILGKG